MSIQELGSLGELIAAIATIATLAYLAMQIRQNTESLSLGAELEVSQQSVNWHMAVAQDPELARIYDAAVSGAELTEAETARYLWLIAAAFIAYEGQWEYYRKGHLSENSWRPKVTSLLATLENPIIRSWWDLRMAPLNEEFREYIESLELSDYEAAFSQQVVGSIRSESR